MLCSECDRSATDEWIPAAVDESAATIVVLNAAIERCFANASRHRCKDVQTARPTIQRLYPLMIYHCFTDSVTKRSSLLFFEGQRKIANSLSASEGGRGIEGELKVNLQDTSVALAI